MFRDENAANQAVLGEKEGILQAFYNNSKKLINTSNDKAQIAELCDAHNFYKGKIDEFRKAGVLSASDIAEIALTFDYLSKNSNVNLKASQLFDFVQVKSDFEAYRQEGFILNASTQFQLKNFGSKFSIGDIKEAFRNTLTIINACKTNQYTPEKIKPLVTALANFFIEVMLEIAQGKNENISALKECRDATIIRLNLMSKLGLVSGDDAYRIACSIAFITKSNSSNDKDAYLAKLQIEAWKNYAAQAGNVSAIREKNAETNDFILKSWKLFLQETASVKTNLFKNTDRDAVIDLQKQLGDLAEGDSTVSSKQMLHVVTAYYLEQLASRGPKDSFLSKLSSVIIDILIEMSQWDEKIKTVLVEEGKNAYSLVNKRQGEPRGDELKGLLLASPIVVKTILTSLHMAQPEVNRTDELGPEYVGPGFGTGHGL